MLMNLELLIFFWLFIVIEAKGEEKSVPKLVERWGEPDSTRAVVAASIIDRELDPVWFLWLLGFEKNVSVTGIFG